MTEIQLLHIGAIVSEPLSFKEMRALTHAKQSIVWALLTICHQQKFHPAAGYFSSVETLAPA